MNGHSSNGSPSLGRLRARAHMMLAGVTQLSGPAILLALAGPAHAGKVVFDGTTGPAGAAPFSSQTYTIDQAHGLTVGTNLFHSFSDFNIDSGETALFTGAGINNIISRVTGGRLSTINGTVRSTVDAASFWFMNPAGIIVGPTGTFDVTGGLYNNQNNGAGLALSTASYIAFADGKKWFADPNKPSALSSTTGVDVVNFGFSAGVTPGDLSVSSTNLLPQYNSLSFVELMGGHVQLNGTTIYPQGNYIPEVAVLLVAGTDIRIVDSYLQSLNLALVSVKDLSTLSFVAVNNAYTSVQTFTGSVPVAQRGRIELDHNEPGTDFAGEIFAGEEVYIYGGDVISTNSVISSGSYGAGDGQIRFDAGSIALHQSVLEVSCNFVCGSIDLLAGAASGPTGQAALLIDGSQLDAEVQFSGRAGPEASAGPITLRAPNGSIRILGNTSIDTSDVLDGANGSAGVITVSAGHDITLDGIGIATSTNSSDATASPASILLTSTGGKISIIDGTQVSATTAGAAAAGSITLEAPQTLIDFSSLNTSTSDVGRAGTISIHSPSVTLNGANVNSSSVGSGAGGSIQIPDAHTVAIHAGQLSTSTSAAGKAGDISITANGADAASPALLIDNGATLKSSSSGSAATATAGKIALSAPAGTIQIGSAQGVASIESADTGASGNAGDVSLTGSSLVLIGASIDTSVASHGVGTAAAIGLTATESAQLTNTNLTAQTTGTVPAGSISISANSIGIRGGSIQASTSAPGAAADINLTADGGPVFISGAGGGDIQNGGVASTSTGSASGAAGKIKIAGSNVDLEGASLSTSVGSSNPPPHTGSAQISLSSPGSLTLNGASLTAETTGSVPGGDVLLTGGSVSIAASTLSAQTSSVANAGKVSITGGSGSSDNPISISDSKLSSDAVAATGANAGAGAINVQTGGNITVSNSALLSRAGAAGGIGGDVTIDGKNVSVSGVYRDGTGINTSTAGAGKAGDVSITANGPDNGATAALWINGGATLKSSASSGATGNAGKITLSAPAGTIGVAGDSDHPTSIASAVAGSSGQAGDVSMTAANLELTGTSVDTSVASQSSGSAAAINLTASGSAELNNTSVTAQTTGAVAAGNITIKANSIEVQGGTIEASTAGSGGAGDISLGASGGSVQISGMAGGHTAVVDSTSTGAMSGPAGQIKISGSSVDLSHASLSTSVASTKPQHDTTPAQIAVTSSGAITVSDSALNAETTGALVGGDVFLAGQSVTIAESTLSAQTSGSANAGEVSITSSSGPAAGTSATRAVQEAASLGNGMISITGSRLSSDAVDASGSAANAEAISVQTQGDVSLSGSALLSRAGAAGGAGGNVLVGGRNVSINGVYADGTGINTSTAGSGTAGRIDVLASGALDLSGASIQSASTATDANAGAAGSIKLAGGAFDIRDSQIAATIDGGSATTAPANITLTGAQSDRFQVTGSSITTVAQQATGGDISVDAGGAFLWLVDSQIKASAGQLGNGGNISIWNANSMVLENASVLAQADAGNGGRIGITLRDGSILIRDPASQINADSQTGINGQVDINSPDTDLNAAVKPQNVAIRAAPDLRSATCVPNSGARSTFAREGAGGVPESPESYKLRAGVNVDSSTSIAAPAAASSDTEVDRPTNAKLRNDALKPQNSDMGRQNNNTTPCT